MGKGVRDLRYDAVKGLAIILMVIGHAGCWKPLGNFIYLFHMPVFFIVAGWFYQTPTDCMDTVRFCWKRLLRIWSPLVFWASIVVLFHDAFVKMGFYCSPGSGLEDAFARWGLSAVWGMRETLYHWGRVFLMRDGMVGMGAPYWFLPVFLYATIGYMLLDFALSKMPRIPRLVIVTLTLLLLVWLARYTDVQIVKSIAKRLGGRNAITAMYLIHLGVVVRCLDLKVDRISLWWQVALVVLCAGCLLAILPLGTLGLSDNVFPSVWFLTVSSLGGWFLLCVIGGIPGLVQQVLSCIGKHTLSILLMHLFVFKGVSAMGIALRGDAWSVLGRPVISYSGFWWCVIYSLVGVALPIVISDAWQWQCQRIKRIWIRCR